MTVPKKRKYRRSIRATAPEEPAAAIDKILAEARERVPHCSFCKKSQNEVKKLICGGPKPPVCICNECIDICNEIIADDQQQESRTGPPM